MEAPQKLTIKLLYDLEIPFLGVYWKEKKILSWRVIFNSMFIAVIITIAKKWKLRKYLSMDQIRSVAQSCPTLCDPMNCSTPGLPVHHQLPEFTETHIHRVSDAIQPSHPLLSPSPLAPNPSHHQSLFQRVNSSHEVAKVDGCIKKMLCVYTHTHT